MIEDIIDIDFLLGEIMHPGWKPYEVISRYQYLYDDINRHNGEYDKLSFVHQVRARELACLLSAIEQVKIPVEKTALYIKEYFEVELDTYCDRFPLSEKMADNLVRCLNYTIGFEDLYDSSVVKDEQFRHTLYTNLLNLITLSPLETILTLGKNYDTSEPGADVFRRLFKCYYLNQGFPMRAYIKYLTGTLIGKKFEVCPEISTLVTHYDYPLVSDAELMERMFT